MKRLLPNSLLGQMLLILLAGLIVSNAIGAWIYYTDRETAVRAVGGLATAQRMVNLTRLVADVPDEMRHRIVASSSDQSFRVAVLHQKPQLTEAADRGPVADAVRSFLIAQLNLDNQHTPVVVASEPADWPGGPLHDRFHGSGPGPGPLMGMGRGRMMMGMMMGGPPLTHLAVLIPLKQGEWLSFSTALPSAGSLFSNQFIISMLVMALVIVAVSIWAARRVTAPLASLAAAAQRLGKDVEAPPIPETGTRETQAASRAFNEMQVQLRQLIENRTRLLAAISHDLRTPLTLLRLRAENVADAEEKEKMLATLAEMDAMVGATLQYAREDMSTEPLRRTDLTALVQSVVDDMADAGRDVAMESTAPILLECRPTALKRVITNLIDNAIKYGNKAEVAIGQAAGAIEITVDDAGPGLPEAELARVFQPFYRVEGSRSRETGGVGLGLAIARSLVERHRGTLTLANRPEGGLRARITLPA